MHGVPACAQLLAHRTCGAGVAGAPPAALRSSKSRGGGAEPVTWQRTTLLAAKASERGDGGERACGRQSERGWAARARPRWRAVAGAVGGLQSHRRH